MAVTLAAMGQSFPIVMEEFCQLFRGAILNRRHLFEAFLSPLSQDQYLPASFDLMTKGIKVE
jgi:hypothetical protein